VKREHQINERTSPSHRMATCSCGWGVSLRRTNGAWMTLSKRINEHLVEVAPRPELGERWVAKDGRVMVVDGIFGGDTVRLRNAENKRTSNVRLETLLTTFTKENPDA
jgi:hypothetical protein